MTDSGLAYLMWREEGPRLVGKGIDTPAAPEQVEAVKRFAGPDYQVAVFEPEARRLLSRIEPVANHYEVRVAPGPGL